MNRITKALVYQARKALRQALLTFKHDEDVLLLCWLEQIAEDCPADEISCLIYLLVSKDDNVPTVVWLELALVLGQKLFEMILVNVFR